MSSTKRRWLSGEGGFTIIESMVAVTILSLAIVVTVQPLVGAIRRIADARIVGVAENLAQAEIESMRALDYEDIGIPGRTPNGVLAASREVTVEGRRYLIETSVLYAGSVTGLRVLPQGGDGVQGTWDPGVDYKVASVTVTASGRESDPITMSTIISPPRLGAHEGIANVRVAVVAYEPFAPSTLTLPTVKITASPAAPIRSPLPASVQVFPAIAVGTYTVQLDEANGWVILPEDILSGADRVTASAGSTRDASIRVYRPASLSVTVRDSFTNAAIAGARVTLTRLVTGTVSAGAAGQYEFANVIPGAYDIRVTATGYRDLVLTSVNMPSGYPDDMSHELGVILEPVTPPTTTTTTTTTTIPSTTTTTGGGTTTTTTVPVGMRTVTFTVVDNTGIVINGATVTVVHPTRGVLQTVTDRFGAGSLSLEPGTDFTASGTTPWGHGVASAGFNPSTRTAVDLMLTLPQGTGKMTLIGGRNAELLYSAGTTGTWVAMPANSRGEASFVGSQGTYRVSKRCLVNGTVVGEKSVSVKAGKNRSTSISGSCP